MLFLFLFSCFKKPNPREVDLTTWPERSKEMLRRETTLDHCHQYNTPCNVCFQINRNLDSVVSCSQHSILLIPVKAEHLPQGITMSCHHLQSLLQPHQKPDPLGSRLTPLGSIGLPITAFVLYLLQITVSSFSFFLSGHSFSAFRAASSSFSAEPPGKPENIGVGSLSLLQQIFPTQESNQGLLHHRQILYHLSYQGGLY